MADEQLISQLLQRQRVNPVRKAIGNAMITLGGGQVQNQEDDDILERLIKYNQLQTSSPDFRMREAQVRADMAVQQGLDLERAKRDEAAAAYDAAAGGGTTPQPAPGQRVTRKYEPSIGRFVETVEPESPSMMARREKATTDLYDTVQRANLNFDKIDRGLESAPRLPQGLFGSWQIKAKNLFGSQDPMLADWQNMKSLLTDAQLKYTAQTKGAISDREMALFQKAVANDDIQNVMRQKNVLEAFKRAVASDQEAKANAFSRSFGENPRTWEDLNFRNPYSEMRGGPVLPPAQQFGTEVEARKNALRNKYANR